MSFKIEAVTVLPAIALFILSSYLTALAMELADPHWHTAFLAVGTCLFFGGIIFSLSWFYYWGIRRGIQERMKR